MKKYIARRLLSAPYRKSRTITYSLAFATLCLSAAAGIWVYRVTQGSVSGDFSAAGQVAAVIPGFAGVVLAAFALSAYMREEDGVLKLAEEAWRGRNRFLFCSQYLYYSVDSALGHSSDNLTCFDGVKEVLERLFPEFQSCLLNTELSRALAQKEIEEKRGDGSKAIFAVRGFIEQVEYFVKADPDDVSAFRDREAEEIEAEEQKGNLTKKQLLDLRVDDLVCYWATLADIIEDLQSVEEFEELLRQNYNHSVKADLHRLMKEHDLGE